MSSCAYWPFIYLLWIMSIQSLWPFLIRLCVFLLLSSLYLGYKSITRQTIFKIFSHWIISLSCWCSLQHKSLLFIYVLFSFVACTFGTIRILPNPKARCFMPLSSSKSFLVLAIILKFFIHFELILYLVWGRGQTSFLYMWRVSCLSTIYW